MNAKENHEHQNDRNQPKASINTRWVVLELRRAMMFEKGALTNDLIHKFLVECWSSYALQDCPVLSTALKFWFEVSFIYLEVVKMSKQIINLTSDIVAKEIENVLDTYPYHPYQQAFAIPDIRQKLTAYVLSRTRNFYIEPI